MGSRRKFTELPAKVQQRIATLVLIVLVVLIGSIWSAATHKSPEEKARQQSSLACNRFRRITADVANGLLTDQELRIKLKEVYDDA